MSAEPTTRRSLLTTSFFLLAVLSARLALGDAFRSVDVRFQNLTGQTLTKVNQDRPHGIWVSDPPQTIPPNAVVHWRSESQGINTGTEAWVIYRIVGGPEVKLWWDNPAEGANDYDIAPPAGYEGEHVGGVGNNANVEFILRRIQVWDSNHREAINDLRVRVITSEINSAGTNNNVWFDVGPLQWKLGDSFDRGSDNTFPLDLGSFKGKITTAEITRLRLHKKGVLGMTNSPDGVDGEWKPREIVLIVNGRPLYSAYSSKWLKAGDPLWTRYLLNAPIEELFARSQRMERHEAITHGDENVAVLTTEVKLAGVSGWCHTGQNWCHEIVPDACGVGTLYMRPAVSTDGLATIDLGLESLDVGRQHFEFNDDTGIPIPRFLRVEFKFGPIYAALPRGISEPHLPANGDRVRICGEVRWDSDNAGWYEIHPKAADQVAVLGPRQQQFFGRFDMTIYSKQFLYAVKPSGELLWYQHLTGVNKDPSQQTSSDAVRKAKAQSSVTGKVAASPSPGPASRAAATQTPGVRQSPATAQAIRRAAEIAPPAQIVHRLDGPKLVGVGWQGFREVIPAGLSGFYGLTSNGVLKWYRHDGFADGTPKWKGPVDVATGWNSFKMIVAAGDGVLYGIGADGSLRWYRHGDVADATARPNWSGPLVVAQGWSDFVHVFSTGEGVIYAVTPDGRLMWYRHLGYLTGAPQWQGPKQVGTGWANFKSVFSPGSGIVYVISPAGELFWYRNDGYLDGTARWQGPTRIADGWGNFVQVFPRMWGTPQPTQVH